MMEIKEANGNASYANTDLSPEQIEHQKKLKNMANKNNTNQ